jgi:orotate phosphoribosyltransferase-like protein
MGTPSGSQDTDERVRELYSQGLTRRHIREALGVTEWTVTEASQEEPLQEPSNRLRAKDDLRAKARDLRLQGLYYGDIAAQLHVSKSTLSLWLRHPGYQP